MTNEFAIASAEINEILKHLSDDQVNKIPPKLRKFFNEIKIENYKPHITPEKSILEQNISKKTKDILVIFYRKYWSDASLRNKIDQRLIENEEKYQEELRNKYNPNNIFAKNNIKEEKTANEEPNSIMIIEKKGLLGRIIDKLKMFFSGPGHS